ncbi:hypothetical protein BDN72DRAFT_791474, partial [Pluteus cervinus]
MDVVSAVRGYLENWKAGGEAECRNMLVPPHCNLSDSSCVDVLVTAYHTLLSSTFKTWGFPLPFTAREFVDFVKSVLSRLPSSSSSPSSWMSSRDVSVFGEHLVDMIWALDVELEEIIAEAKLAIGDEQAKNNSATTRPVEPFKRTKQNAEADKETLQVVARQLLECGVLNPSYCRERLDTSILAGVGLIADKLTLDRKEIRTRTALFYKQNKFNLLREQSEGYSKLTAELTSSLGPAHASSSGRPAESWTAIEDRAKPVWEKVISLIGYFDLDPNRALDVILDVLSVHLATHYSFFLALLSFSPWSASFRRPTPENSMKVDIPPGSYTGKTFDEVLSLITPCLPDMSHSSSARVLAQVLGFKMAYYHSPNATEVTPKNLYLTAAILIREGFMSLEDLYPHILPEDGEMGQVHTTYLGDVEARMSGAKVSQLAMAAPLESSSSSSGRPKVAAPPEPRKQPEAKEPSNNQKIGLLIGLLSVGALKPALAILTKFPWLVDTNPEIADLIIRILKVSISGLYDSVTNKERNPSFTQPRARFGTTGLVPPPPKKSILTLWAPTPPNTSTADFVFFFPDWTEQIPLCTSLDDLVDVLEPLMRFIGLHISRDPLFLTKFLRLGRMHLQSTIPIDAETKKPTGEPDPENPVRIFWFNVLRVYLLPALPLIRGNAVCTVEVWNIIRQYETTARWRLYGEWKTHVYGSHPELRVREIQADREAKGLLRRLSHNTIDTLSGTVAKLAHSNPCVFFKNAVNQIMAYDNLAGVVIQALRYVTNMGFDVLVFMSLDALANPAKARVKVDGVNISDWLQSLASFIGMLFRRYSADLTPTLKYIVHQLHNEQATEIVVLRELIWKMAGIEPLPSLSDSQITAMAGGPILRVEAVASSTRGARVDPADVLKGPQRLGRALLDSSLALPLLIQVAKQRQACVFKAPDAHLKSLASLFDTTHGVLLQYLELLTSPNVVSSHDYEHKVLPPLADLGEKYGICAPICMQIIRPVLHAHLLKAALDANQEQERIASEEAEKRLKAALTAKRELPASRVASPTVGNAAMPDDAKPSGDPPQALEESSMDVDSGPPAPTVPESPWHPVLAALFDDIRKIAPASAIDIIGPGFYLTFWQLSTYDLCPPGAKYDEEGAALRALWRQEDSKYVAADRSADRAKRMTAASHRTRRDRYNTYVDLLAKEFKEQTISRAFTLKRIAKEKNHWFTHTTAKGSTLVNALIEQCIQPRCLLSPMDADFCAEFIKVLHTQGTPGFHTLRCYDYLLGDHVKVVLFSCSEYEARNYGRFLLGILDDLKAWFDSKEAYNTDNQIKVGKKTAFLPGFSLVYKNKGGSAEEWSNFKTILHKWHRKLAKSFIDCIETGEFMHVYNTIIVLKEILPVFPTMKTAEHGIPCGVILDHAIDTFLEKEERGDLKILGRAYSASLKKREAAWKPQTNGVATPSSQTQAGTPTTEKRNPISGPLPTPPTAPNAHNANDSRRAQPTQSTPSAPRAQLLNNTHPQSAEKPTLPTSSKFSLNDIPRPEVVRRVRTDAKNSESPKPPMEGVTPTNSGEPPRTAASSDTRTKEDAIMAGRNSNAPSPRYNSPSVGPDSSRLSLREASHPANALQTSATATERPGSPRPRAPEDKSRMDITPAMPPPSVPSQTASAQELRETAKQSISRSEKAEDKGSRYNAEVRGQNGSAAHSPRHRSSSPASGPGTRNPSSDSRASGERIRSDRGNTETMADDRRADRDSRSDGREHTSSTGRRDSITHTRSRSGRERQSGRDADKDDKKEGDRERERERGRHGDRDREKDRDRERDRERERDRDRDRERERERDRDRHRRDEKDRDRKERDSTSRSAQAANSSTPQDDRGLPTRPDPSRHRNAASGEDNLGKRRRATDDDPERGSKRSSRKDSHREDRSRRPGDKDVHDRGRDSDRRKEH